MSGWYPTILLSLYDLTMVCLLLDRYFWRREMQREADRILEEAASRLRY